MRALSSVSWILILALATAPFARCEEGVSAVEEAARKLPATFKGRPLHFIPKRPTPAQLTGDLSDPVWKTATVIPLLEYRTGQAPGQPSEVLAFCTDEALYFGARFVDTQPPSVLNEWAVYQNDCFEMFLMPGESVKGTTYFEMAVDAQNHFAIARLHIYPNLQPVKGICSAKPDHAAAETKGGGFTAVVCLKFNELDMTEGAKNKKELWRMDLVRNRAENANDPKARYSSAPTLAERAHIATKMGYFLPETFATPELIAETIARAESAKNQNGIKAEDVTAIDTAVANLSAEAYGTRTDAFAELTKWAESDAAHGAKVKEALEKAIKNTEDAELRASAGKLIELVQNAGDDDPPPASAPRAGKQGPVQDPNVQVEK